MYSREFLLCSHSYDESEKQTHLCRTISPVNLSNIQLDLTKIATEIILTFLSTVTPLETNMKNRLELSMGKLSFWGKTSIYEQKIGENWKTSNICISHEICTKKYII